ncbi:UDP-N-acetylglucosamine-peptide N-acetylglucosaminyltransferase [Thraustotheca clavata]|uniref:protein O-GlcNAc transferase n=1 Tax=Thraustotheca clavata TaxID=74557 RepID=A0A1W0A3C9_9STRA|nr:UDP-N-acetylglucosamine-peptide N-acetylglucosaminyltransferase [Thraustotheca clavata]
MEAISIILQLKPSLDTLANAMLNKGEFLSDLGKLQQALYLNNQALVLMPNSTQSLIKVYLLQRQLCHWENKDDFDAKVINTAMKEIKVSRIPALRPFDATLMPISDSIKMQLAIANCKQWQQSITLVSTNTKYTTKPLKIGYMSYDYRNHPMGQLTVGAFEHHNHSDFHITAYSYGPNDASEWRQRIVDSADTFYDMQSWSDVDIANRIVNDEISVLVDLMAHTRGARVGISSLHPAPILVNFLGYPGTMGASFMDYAIVDTIVVPPMVALSTFTEKLVYLPHTYQVNDYEWTIDTCIDDCGNVAMEFGSNVSFVFCNFNTINKMEPLSFDSWMRILSRVPGSVLWLLEPSAMDIGVMKTFRMEAASRGIDPHRLVFAPRVSKREHLERLRYAHLFLDSFIYNAHSTASDMIWANLPLLTLQGDTFASRVASSLVEVSVGCIASSILVAHSMKEFEDLAVALATTHRGNLSTIRAWLAKSFILDSRLFDSAMTTSHLEESYKAMADLLPNILHIIVFPSVKNDCN